MIKSLLKSGYKLGFFHLLTANAFIQIAAFGSQVLVAGMLPPEDIGRIKILQTYLSLFVILGSLGFNASTLKFCSENRDKEDKKNLFTSAFYLTFISTSLLYVILLVLNHFHIFSSDNVIISIFPIAMLLIITNSLFMVFMAYYQAEFKIEHLSRITSVNKLLTIISIIGMCYWIGVRGYYFATNVSLALVLGYCLWNFRREFGVRFDVKSLTKYFKTHIPYASKSMFSYLISELSAYVDIILISYFIADLKEVGYYGFALTMTVVIRLIPSTIQQISIPQFSKTGENVVAHQQLFRKYNRLTIILVFVLFLLLIILVPLLMHQFLGTKYNKSLHYFPLLALGWSLRVLSVFPNGVMFSIGRVKYNVYISVILLVTNVALFPIMLHFWGLIGAASLSVFSGLLSSLLSYYFYNKSFVKLFKS